jgi:hypothetical protein
MSSSDYKYNGLEYQNSFGCAFHVLDVFHECADDVIVVVKDNEEPKTNKLKNGSKSICKEAVKWFSVDSSKMK